MVHLSAFFAKVFGPAAESATTCPVGHEIVDVAVRCATCGRFVLFVPAVFKDHKVRSLAQGMVIVLSTVAAFVLFRYTKEVWPLYWFLLLGVVHMYAMIFTRGTALGSATWFLAGSAAVSAAWTAARGSVHPAVAPTGAAGVALWALPVLAWLLITGYMFILGRRGTMSAIRTPSTYFLAAATFTLGFWGVWIFYLENGLVTTTIYQIAIGIGLLLPVLSVLFLFALPDRASVRRWLVSLAALALVVLAGNLTVIEPLVAALAVILGEFFPRLTGVPPLDDIATQWLGGHEWRATVTSVMLLVAVALVVVQAALETSRIEARAPASKAVPAAQPAGPAAQPSTGPTTAPARGAARTRPGDRRNPAEEAAEETFFVARFLGEFGVAIVANILKTVRRAFSVVLPVVAFSLLSMLIVLVLGKLGEYLRHGPFSDALSLWGMTLTILVAVVILCGIAFDSSPSQRETASAEQTGDVQADAAAPQTADAQPANAGPQTGGLSRSAVVNAWRIRRRVLGVPLVVIAAGSLLGSLGYFLVSLASSAMLPMLWPAAPDAITLFSGDLYFANLVISVIALGLLAGLFAIGTVRWWDKAPKLLDRYLSISAAVILTITAGASVYFGAAPIRTTFAFVTGPYAATATQELRDRVPVGVAASCAGDYLLLPGQLASLSCRSAGTTDVSYHLFDSAGDLGRWYADAVRARGVSPGHGSCAHGWPAESVEPNGIRVACYVDRRGAWLLWSDSGSLVLGIAFRLDGRAEPLYALWSTGALGVRPG